MDASEVLEWLEKKGTRKVRDGMSRYGIVAQHAVGVPMAMLMTLSKKLGPDHPLAIELWESGCYEARLLASMVGEPELVTRAEMDAWAASFENWADCDTVCFKLWDRSPFAWDKARQWSKSPHELIKRGGFVLMACLALHDRGSPDAQFLAFLPLIEKGAADERNIVMKAVSWALRSIGRRNRTLHQASIDLARRLAEDKAAAPRWIGKDALRELSSAKVRERLAKKAPAARK
ncbi:MAG: DNA alkylation repair protein, partial [Rhodanobacteraceae bacterium]